MHEITISQDVSSVQPALDQQIVAAQRAAATVEQSKEPEYVEVDLEVSI